MDTRMLRKMVIAAALVGATTLPAHADQLVLVLEGEEASLALTIGVPVIRCIPVLPVLLPVGHQRHYGYVEPCYERRDGYREAWPGRVEHHDRRVVRQTTVVRREKPAVRQGGQRWDGDRGHGARWDQGRRGASADGRSYGHGNGHASGRGNGRGDGNGWKTRKASW